MKITIIANNPNSEAVRAISLSIMKRGHVAQVLKLEDIRIAVSNNSKGYDSLQYIAGNKTKKLSKACLGDAIIPRIGTNVPYGIKVIDHITKNLGTYSCISSLGLLNAYDKMRTLQIASSKGIRTPKSYMSDNYKDYNYIASQFKMPLVIKHIHGSLGAGVSIIESKLGLKSTLQAFSKIKKPFLIQEFVEGGSKDLRAVVIGSKVVAAYQRKARRGDFRANLSQGGSGRSISLSEADKKICVKSANALGLDICGVDLMKDNKGKTYLIELNSNFGWKVAGITGVNVGNEIVKFLEKNIGNQALRNINSEKSRKYITEIFPEVHGKKIHFIDRSNRKRTITIQTIQDLEVVMLDSFRLNIKK
jgi:ribosomal protein S6--L-glutamate ligase